MAALILRAACCF